MIPLKDLKTPESWERFLTTYNSDYKSFSELHLQDNQLNHRTEAQPAPAFISPPQTKRETWPIIHQYFYTTSNNTYGSCPKPPSCSLYLSSSPPVSEVTGVAGSDLTEARTETIPVLVEKGKGHLHYVIGGNANVLEQQEAKDELQQKGDVLFEEGVIVLSSHVIPVCCEDFLSCVCRAAGLQRLLNLPVVSSPIIQAGNWGTGAYLRGWRQAAALGESTFLQPTSKQCSCAGETECTDRRCFDMPPYIHQSSSTPLFQVVPPVCSREPLLTEYQASYSAGIQQSDFHHHHPPRQCLLHPSF